MPLTDEHYVITWVLPWRQLVVEPGNGTRHHDLTWDALIPLLDPPTFDRDARTVRWSTEGAAPVDAVHASLGLRTPDDSDSWPWYLYAPGDLQELVLPDLPDEVFPATQYVLSDSPWPEVVLVDFDDGTYSDAIRWLDIYLRYMPRGPSAALDAYDVPLPATRWRMAWGALPEP